MVASLWAMTMVRAAGHEIFQALLYQAFIFGIERAGRFVQQQQRRVAQHGAGYGNALALTARQGYAAFADQACSDHWACAR